MLDLPRPASFFCPGVARPDRPEQMLKKGKFF